MFTIHDALTQRAGVLLLRGSASVLTPFHGIARPQRGFGRIESRLAGHGLPTWLAFGVLIGKSSRRGG